MERAKEFNIQLDDVAITHLSFGTEARRHGNAHILLGGCWASAAYDMSPYDTNADGHHLCLQFTKAVESKQVAQQDAERARFVVMRADQVP